MGESEASRCPFGIDAVSTSLIDTMLHWRLDGHQVPPDVVLAVVTRGLERPDLNMCGLEWRTLQVLVEAALKAHLLVPPQVEAAVDAPEQDEYRVLSRAAASGIAYRVDRNVGTVAEDVCLLIHRCNYVEAARGLTVMVGGSCASAPPWAEPVVHRFIDQALGHLTALAQACTSQQLIWELRLFDHVKRHVPASEVSPAC
ncbi:hypothetical protein KBP30_06050 [Streptomyces sp. Go40/10]|uniref:hypothetical protein n=1 Tax=Streptomyces sp. Go40/10 TaxID=2825844 RepID=UPI001E65BC0E|nr:hypothetical protein [Streptomyces sp. Go40/10]UFR00763.1 hypothetical protein KBP30_06050 [Streptomyces sp. Go40/10]